MSRFERLGGASLIHPGRVTIEKVQPELCGGRLPIKRTVGEKVVVTADIFADGHDVLRAMLRYRADRDPSWLDTAMDELGNDVWRGNFPVEAVGKYEYTIEAWTDPFKTWRRDFAKKVEAQQDICVDLLVGTELIAQASMRASGEDATQLVTHARSLRSAREGNLSAAIQRALAPELAALMEPYSDRRQATRYEKVLHVVVDREKARFSAWYEMFPRSTAREPGQHGTLKDCAERVPYVAEMGFDVLYLPPIHPIGRTHRKGKNNSPICSPEDVGSPWAIGAEEGGHKAIHPQLGTLEDFQELMAAAKKQGIEIALDAAFQCTPDHPYVQQHPEWFRRRPDGSVQYAENPPKKYEDIFPLNFETNAWCDLWNELKSIILFWIEQGVRIFRVDNPHTKPFAFWEWLINEIKQDYPEVIFLSEAFTRPKVMHQLARLGFTQSYTYFAWRNTKQELIEYFTELTRTEVREYFRPSLWTNTPDILTEYLQFGGRPAFMTRLALAATLGASYGIYGPPFELCENRALRPGSEEYLDSEKYEIRHWDIRRSDSLKPFITRVNRVRRENPALHSDSSLQFHPVDNDQLIAYTKATEDLSNVILVVVNLDPHHTQSGWVELPLESLGLPAQQPFQVHDLLDDARYLWQGPRNYVQLNPQVVPSHIFRVRRRLRTERDFDYFL